MVVECIICSAVQLSGDGTANKKGPDSVTSVVGLYFVKREDYEGVVHKVGVVEQRSDKAPRPIGGDGDGRVVSVVGHVWSDK